MTQLIQKKIAVKIVIREQSKIPVAFVDNKDIEILRGEIDKFDSQQVRGLIADCDAVVSCLGHNLSLKGMFGPPHRLVSHFVERVTEAANSYPIPKRLILMSTTAYTNAPLGETNSFKDKLILSLLRLLLPPHRDNMIAGDHLLNTLGPGSSVEWVAVRPDTLIDLNEVSEYDLYETRQRNPISDAGKTSRINVAHFMLELLTEEEIWQEWRYKTPVIYNRE